MSAGLIVPVAVAVVVALILLRVIGREAGALQLRTLQTLAEVATEHNSTLVSPIPVDLLDGYRGASGASVDNA